MFVCDVANHKVFSKLKVSRNVPVKFGVFARRSSILFVNSVESVIKCDYSTPPYCIAMTEQMTWSCAITSACSLFQAAFHEAGLPCGRWDRP